MVERHPDLFRAATDRVLQPVRDKRAPQVEAKTRWAQVGPELMEVAKDLARDPEAMFAPGSMDFSPEAPPPNFDPGIHRITGDKIPVWMERAYRVAGAFDERIGESIQRWAASMAHGLDDLGVLADLSGVEAMARFFRRSYGAPLSEEEARDFAQGEFSTSPECEREMVTLMFDFAVDQLIRTGCDMPLSRDRCYEVLVQMLPFLDPDLEPARLGLPEDLRTNWESGDAAGTFAQVEDARERLWLLSERALDYLRGSASCSHSPDFRSVRWFGTSYEFNPAQAHAVRVLWGAWEQGGLSVGQERIAEEIGSSAGRYRLLDTFRSRGVTHEAFRAMIQRAGKGAYKLVPPDAGSSHPMSH